MKCKYAVSFLIVLISHTAFANLPIATGSFFGGGTYRFLAKGISGPYSIHYEIAQDALDANALNVTIDNSLSSSGAYFLKIIFSPNQTLQIELSDGAKAGDGYCFKNVCRLGFQLPTVTVTGQPVVAVFDLTLTKSLNGMNAIGSVAYGGGARFIGLYEELVQVPAKRGAK
jgi:hypothetical protein